MECPAEKIQKDENYKQIMLVAAGSAMAASCEPCLNVVIPNLIEVGVPDTEIRRAVEIGQFVKDREAEIMKEAADVLAGTSFLDEEIPEHCAQDEMEILKADKTSMLIAVGAAVAGKCASCLDTVARELKAAGVPNQEIRGAVEIGSKVAAKSRDFMADLIEEPTEGAVAPQGDQGESAGCGCS